MLRSNFLRKIDFKSFILFVHLFIRSFTVEKSKRGRKRVTKAPASVSATYSSTVAEEFVTLLRRLHSLENWNQLVNQFISERLGSIALMTSSSQVW